MSELVIRVAGPHEAAVLAALVAGFRDHLRATEPSDAALRAHLPRALADPALEFACAWLGDEAVGYTQTRFVVSVWAPPLEAHLEDLFVVERARRSSVGRALLDHALARAEAREARRFGLTTNEQNRAAQALYRSAGLTAVTHASYPGGREVLWSRSLGGATPEPGASRTGAGGGSVAMRGGCLCGSIRYEVGGAPTHETLCHCSICRRASGAPAVAWFTVPRASYRVVAGEPADFASSDHAIRSFCPHCGTPLTFASTRAPDEIDVTTCSLADPDAVPPRDHTHTAAKPAWSALADGLPAHAGARPR